MVLDDIAQALHALTAISPNLPRDEWVRLGMAAHAAGLEFEDFDAWSSGGATYDARHCRDVWRSFRAGRGIGAGTLFALARQHGWSPEVATVATPAPNRRAAPVSRPVETLKPEGWTQYCADVWGASVALRGTVGAQYLQARGCTQPPEDGDLRFHPCLPHRPSGTTGPALVAIITDAITRKPLGLHRTWVAADGSKPLKPAKMIIGAKHGGVVRLWPDEAVTTGLGIAEGTETALTLAHAFRPVWSCIDAGNLAAFPVLPGVGSLTIAVDNDPAGITAADECAARWHAAGREVRLVMAAAAGADLNDLVRESAA